MVHMISLVQAGMEQQHLCACQVSIHAQGSA